LGSTAATFDANDRLNSDTYDANGNTIGATVTDPYTGLPVAATDTYDHADRLVHRATTLNSQPAAIAYQYDGDGNRVGKTVGGVTTHFVVDEANPTGWPQVMEELSAPSSQLSALAVTRVYSYGYSPLSQDQLSGNAWSASHFGQDAHGNVRYLTDASGHVTDTIDYDAFGSVIHRSGTTATTRLFTGEERDPELGLYNLRARYHNPGTGRFWTRDSFEGYLGNPASRHGYAYAASNPLNLLDPSGHESLEELSAVGAIAPDVDRAVDSFWIGINHYIYGLGGGAAAGPDGKAVLAVNGVEAQFIQGLSQHAGINIGKDNFFATMQGAPFLLAPNPYVFVSPSPCFRYELLSFDPDLPVYGCPNRNPIFTFDFSNDPTYQFTEKLLNIGRGSIVGADLREWAAEQAQLGTKGSGDEGLWANFGYGVRSTVANMAAGLISPSDMADGIEHVQDRAVERMAQKLNGGSGAWAARYEGWASIGGDLIGLNSYLEGQIHTDLASGQHLDAAESASRTIGGLNQMVATLAMPVAGAADRALAREVQTLNAQRLAVADGRATETAAKVAGKDAAAANAADVTAGPKPCPTAKKPLLLQKPRTPLQWRNTPGLAYGSDLSLIGEGEQWLRGTSANAGRIPGQIAERLAGRSFESFDEFREAFWQEVANDPVLSQQFGPNSLREMQAGRAPFAPASEQVGGRIKYEIDHMTEIQDGGNVYDMNNLIIRTPVNHIGK